MGSAHVGTLSAPRPFPQPCRPLNLGIVRLPRVPGLFKGSYSKLCAK